MNPIDWSAMITAEAAAEEDAQARAAAIKTACSARIRAVLDPCTVANIQGAALAGALSPAQMESFRAGQRWIAAMLAASRAAIAGEDDPAWPEIPAGVKALAKAF